MQKINDINIRIREIRNYIEKKYNRKMTQEEFATKFLGLTKSAVCDIEHGRRNVTNQHIKLLIVNCEKIHIHLSEDWIRYGKGTIEKNLSREEEIISWAANLTNTSNDSFPMKFAYMLTQLSKDDWKVLERMTNIMLEAKKD